MTLNLTLKERTLLQDQKGHEELCIKKYNDYASKAQSQQLKQLFSSYATKEQEHLNSINQMLNGQIPQMNQQQGQQNQQQGQQQQGQQNQQQGQQGQQQQAQGMQNQQGMNQKGSFMSSADDKNLCEDMLMVEKYVSGAYDTSIFEMTDKNVRQVLNHIQKEEQEHGEGIYNYMKNNGMYNAQ
ncbi:MAG: spore coat protein [Clostridia bacterium]|jgi:spore coat protein CotF|nr:spore coat protein [Clostridia bacterium]